MTKLSHRQRSLLGAVFLSAVLCAPSTAAYCEEVSATSEVRVAVKNDPKLDRSLLEAIKDSEFEEAFEALKKGANPNARGKDGITALMLAAQASNVTLVQALLDGGAETNAVNKDRQTALHFAAQIGAPKPAKKKRFGGLGGLLGGVAVSSAVGGGLGSFGAHGAWASSLLGNAGLDYLLGANLDSFLNAGVFNLTSRSGWNAIIGTAIQGDLNANNSYGVQNLLVNTPGRLDAAGWVSMVGSVKSANPKVYATMNQLEGGANPVWSQFLDAAARGDKAAVATYMADPALQPLIAQAEQGFIDAANELPANAARKIVTALLARGADRSLTDKNGKTALQLAEAAKLESVIEVLKAPPATPPGTASVETKAAADTEVKVETTVSATPDAAKAQTN